MTRRRHRSRPDRQAAEAADAADGAGAHGATRVSGAGQAEVSGTLEMAKYLRGPAIEAEIQALAQTAPRMTADQAARIARLLGWNDRKPRDRPPSDPPT